MKSGAPECETIAHRLRLSAPGQIRITFALLGYDLPTIA